MHILIVEDERTLCETIVRSLRRLAYSVDFCYDGNEALNLLAVEKYDLVLLDLNLPGADGMTVLRQLRQTDKDTRVLILSARSEVSDKVAGLDAGASDYLSKPFHLEELEARIRSLTLRKFTQNDVVLSCGDLSFDTKSRTASVRGQELTLTRKEIGILEYLLLHQGRPVSQEELIEHVWDNSVDSFSNSIRVHISEKSCVRRWDAILYITASEKAMLWRKKNHEKTLAQVAYSLDNLTFDRGNLCVHQSSSQLFRKPIYGLHRVLCIRMRNHRGQRFGSF